MQDRQLWLWGSWIGELCKACIRGWWKHLLSRTPPPKGVGKHQEAGQGKEAPAVAERTLEGCPGS